MKRNMLRATALLAVLGVGIAAVFQAQRFFPVSEANATSPGQLFESALPSGKPMEIEQDKVLLAANTAAPQDEENPLREAPVGRNRRANPPAQYVSQPRQATAEPRRLGQVAEARPIQAARDARAGVMLAQHEEAAATTQPPALIQAGAPTDGPVEPLPPAALRNAASQATPASRYEDPTAGAPRQLAEVPQEPTLAAPGNAAPLGTPAISNNEPELATATARDRLIAPAQSRFPGQAGSEGSGTPGKKTLEGPQSPNLTIQKSAPAEIQVGKQCQFEIVVRNVGQAVAKGVVIHDQVPAGTQFVGAEPGATQGPDGSLVWKIGDLATGRDARITLTLMPINEGEIGSVATVQFQAQASVRTKATKPELVLNMSGPEQVMVGGQVKLAIELSNPGTGAATGVMLLENIPQGTSHAAGDSLEFEVGTLAAGETRTMELTLTAEEAGRVENILVASADANLEARESVVFEVIAPDLVVGIDGPSRRYLERPATYTLSIQNPGTAAAKDILLTSYLPKGMKFVKANNAGTYDAKSHSVSWGLEELPAQQEGSVELVALPTEAGQHKLRVEGKAERGLTDEREQDVMVEGIAAILFEVVDLEDPVEVGGETAYEIRVLNQGSKAASNVNVAVLLPPDMQALSAEGPTREQIEPGRVSFAPLEKLAAKADTTYIVRVQALRAGDQRVRVQVDTDETRTPVTKEESTRVYSDE